MKHVTKASELLSKGLMVFAALWAFFLAFFILADVVLRNLNIPIEGTNVIKGKTLLAESGLSIIAADDLTDAAQKVVAAAAG